jgi:holin-like protein
MLFAFLCLIGCQLIGELAREVFHLPVPGPVIGLFLLAAILVIRGGKSERSVPPALEKTAETLIAVMGLLFVPAGVGVLAEAELLRQEWFPIIVALFGSTVLSVAVTGLVMHLVMQHGKRTDAHDGSSRELHELRHE